MNKEFIDELERRVNEQAHYKRMEALLRDVRRYLKYPINKKSDRQFVIDRINSVLGDEE